MSNFTEDQVKALAAPLSSEHVKKRDQAGRQVSYIEGWHVIAEANRIFGFDGWDRKTVKCKCVAERETKIGQSQADGWRVGYVAKVRVQVRAGPGLIVREGTGYGSGIDRDLGAAHESAIKEAETDGMKRALMTFGNPFGLALYDKKQENVEAPVRAQAVPASPMLPANPEEPPEVAKSRRDYTRILNALNTSASEDMSNDIWTINKAEIAVIKKHGGDAAIAMLNQVDQKRRDALRTGVAA